MISVVVIAENEEEQISDTLESAQCLAEEVILVDHYSEDDTVTIAESLGVDVYQKEWEGVASARNFGFEKASEEWICYLDADEVLTDDLIADIQALPLDETKSVGFRINIVNYVCGEKTNWTVSQVRLFRKTAGRMSEQMHSELILDEGELSTLQGHIIHDTYPTVSESLWKLDRYTRAEAEESSEAPSVYEFYLRPLLLTLNLLIRHRTIFDGKTGVFIAFRKGFYELTKQYRRSLKSKGKLNESLSFADYDISKDEVGMYERDR